MEYGEGSSPQRSGFWHSRKGRQGKYSDFYPIGYWCGDCLRCIMYSHGVARAPPLTMPRQRSAMRIQTTDRLFAWERLEDSPGLATCRQFLELLPDAKLLASLHAWRGKGRNDYPLAVLWRVHLLRYLLRHPTMQACLAELDRTPALRKLAGIEEVRHVPDAWNMSRFAAVLGQPAHHGLMEAMFQELIRRLAVAVPDLGVRVAGDSSALSARPDRDPKQGSPPQPHW